MQITADEALRGRLDLVLRAGLKTEWQSRAYSDADIVAVRARLQQVRRGAYRAILRIAGFMPRPYSQKCLDGRQIDQCCSTCLYFERYREVCELPEVALPVRSEWSCILWHS